ncbi:hypothetical protein RHMOL_Rhmol04G0141500 [Rhododendron molle]|uniref:Uncharacterized protein n=1 Tax=Rhododendron molle TaxID=49168 RepID=A0ACC0P0F0_RHOML|nr:hypothetical protein RHMOL_Rhmol04G0141500 [Rhododendron molle]
MWTPFGRDSRLLQQLPRLPSIPVRWIILGFQLISKVSSLHFLSFYPSRLLETLSLSLIVAVALLSLKGTVALLSRTKGSCIGLTQLIGNVHIVMLVGLNNLCVPIRHLMISDQTDFSHTYSTRRALRSERFRSSEQYRSGAPSAGTARCRPKAS